MTMTLMLVLMSLDRDLCLGILPVQLESLFWVLTGNLRFAYSVLWPWFLVIGWNRCAVICVISGAVAWRALVRGAS